MDPNHQYLKYSTPVTLQSLRQDLRSLGISRGDSILAHSSLSSLGYVCGGEETVVQALQETIGIEGNLVMPTHTPDRTEPSHWKNPPVPESWWPIIRNSMPAFDAATTPSSHMGRIPECFRNFPGVKRSNHPIGSFAAWGRNAANIVADHPIEPLFGMSSPIGRLYSLNAQVLLLGVSYCSCTSLHLSEYLSEHRKTFIEEGTAVSIDGVRTWITFSMLALDTDDFEIIGDAFEQHSKVTTAKVGNATCKLISIRDLVDFSVQWMNVNRPS